MFWGFIAKYDWIFICRIIILATSQNWPKCFFDEMLSMVRISKKIENFGFDPTWVQIMQGYFIV
jgi:hypothetical protein